MLNMTLLQEGERLDDLQTDGLRIIQNPSWFCFGIDAVLLSHFAKVRDKDKVVEFGTGTGVISLLIAGKTKVKSITAFEIQPDVAEMANRSVLLNGLEDRISIITDDLKNVSDHFGKSSVDVVVCNPPYMSPHGLKNPSDQKAISRHEIHCTIEDVITSARNILKVGGALYLVHRPQRLVDIVWAMRQNDLEPKEIRMVQPKAHQKPNIMLIKAVRGAKSELKFLDPLIVYNDDGDYTEEIYQIYGQQGIERFGERKALHLSDSHRKP